MANTHRKKLINVVAVAPNMDPMYLKTTATGVESQAAGFMTRLFGNDIDVLENNLGPDKVAAIITGSAAITDKAWRILKKKSRGVLCNGCAAITLNLLLQDVPKLEVVKQKVSRPRRYRRIS
ncbi:hypothetical protein GN244_ATG11935 [Phytophthora infestans]|uniref:DUF659 domain-containing protein n=1 Tax=Phytophthora infestans TaxID=4787 RepID=A0A833RZA9_PHYIN|nr:hypothetical protein GN244_ATG11935 [Phytophthora infestans]KAF4147622.1 hypothetical protein GN958_ATG03195 [Phytophthora infestans]